MRPGPAKPVDPGDGPPELFGPAADVGGARDPAADRPERVAALRAVRDGRDAGNVPAAPPGFRAHVPAREAFHDRGAGGMPGDAGDGPGAD